MKNSKEGKTSQNIELDKFVIFDISTFSVHIQVIANNEVRGNAAKRAPQIELLFATSLTRTTTIADIITLNK